MLLKMLSGYLGLYIDKYSPTFTFSLIHFIYEEVHTKYGLKNVAKAKFF